MIYIVLYFKISNHYMLYCNDHKFLGRQVQTIPVPLDCIGMYSYGTDLTCAVLNSHMVQNTSVQNFQIFAVYMFVFRHPVLAQQEVPGRVVSTLRILQRVPVSHCCTVCHGQ